MDAVIHGGADWLPRMGRRRPAVGSLPGFFGRLINGEVVERGMVPAGADTNHPVRMRLVLKVSNGFSIDGCADRTAVEAHLHAVPAAAVERDFAGGELLLILLIGGRKQRPVPVRLHAKNVAAGVAGLVVGEYVG